MKNLLTFPLIRFLLDCLGALEQLENINEASISKNISYVYAKLEKQNGKYTFTKFSLPSIDYSHSPRVNLATQKLMLFKGEESYETGSVLRDASDNLLCQRGVLVK
jgi:hypothetical protein